MKRTSGLALASAVLALFGCGGGGSAGSSTPSAPVDARGTATLNVIWPERTDARQIPVAANSLKVTLSQGGTVISTQTIARPAAGQTSTSTTFTDLPLGSLDVSVAAYPTSDASGVAQATGAGTMAVADGVPGAVTVSLVSTVASLTVSPASPHVGRGATATLTASARDASNNIVLLSAGGSEPVVWSASTPGIVSISGTGPVATLTGVATGTVTVTARFTTNDSGSTVSGTSSVTVVSGSGTVTIQ